MNKGRRQKVYECYKNIPYGMVIFDIAINKKGTIVDSTFTYLNLKAIQIIEPEYDLTNITISKLYPNQYKEDILNEFQRVLDSGENVRFQHYIPMNNKFIEVNAFMLNKKQIACIVGDYTYKKEDKENEDNESVYKKIGNCFITVFTIDMHSIDWMVHYIHQPSEEFIEDVPFNKLRDIIYVDYLYDEDREIFLKEFSKEYIKNSIIKSGYCEITFRRLRNRKKYVYSKFFFTLNNPNDDSLIVREIDATEEKVLEEKNNQSKAENSLLQKMLRAVGNNYYAIYGVDISNNSIITLNQDKKLGFILYEDWDEYNRKVIKIHEDLIYPDDLEYVQEFFNTENMKKFFNNLLEKPTIEFRRKVDWKYEWVIGIADSIISDEGNKIVIFSFQNIEKEKEKNAFQRSFVNVLNSIYSSKVIIDLDTFEYTFLSNNMMNMNLNYNNNYHDAFYNKFYLQILKEDVAGSVKKFLSPEGIKYYSNHIDEEIPVTFQMKNFNGQLRWYQALVFYDNVNDSRVAYILLEDITLSIQQREELKNAIVAADAANKAKTQFLNSMSHDIRTPMNAIIGFTEIARNRIDEKEYVDECLKKIKISSNHLLSLINDVLDMSKIEAGKITLTEENISLPKLMENIITLMQPQVKSSLLNFNLINEGIVHENFIGDSLRLNQIFINIIGNSIKFTESGGTIGIKIKEINSPLKGYGRYKFIFSDTGMGMSEEFLKHLFKPFEREDNNNVFKIEGTGLGMSITKNLVDLMGGTIEVVSRKNVGSIFTVTLDFKLIENKNQNEEAILKNKTVMIVDDDKCTLNYATQLIEGIGAKVVSCLNAEEAIEKIKNTKIDYFILDWQLPDLDGVELASKINEILGSEQKIVLTSCYDMSDIMGEAKKSGVKQFLNKPYFKSSISYCFNNLNRKKKDIHEDNLKKQISKKIVLLVEDQEINMEIAYTLITMSGYQCDKAENGKIAIEKVKKSEEGYYGLILMDIRMPIIDGYETTKIIRKLNHPDATDIPIVAMSANAFIEDKKKADEAGMDGYISKPVDVKVLKATLSKYLD